MSKFKLYSSLGLLCIGYTTFIFALVLWYNISLGEILFDQPQLTIEFHPRMQTFDYFPWIISIFAVGLIKLARATLKLSIAEGQAGTNENPEPAKGESLHDIKSELTFRRFVKISDFSVALVAAALAVVLWFDPFGFGLKQYYSRDFWDKTQPTTALLHWTTDCGTDPHTTHRMYACYKAGEISLLEKEYRNALEFFSQVCTGANATTKLFNTGDSITGAGCFNLGEMQRNGWGTANNLGRAANLHRAACELGHLDGCSTAGNLYALRNEIIAARTVLQIGCGQEHLWSCQSLARVNNAAKK